MPDRIAKVSIENHGCDVHLKWDKVNDCGEELTEYKVKIDRFEGSCLTKGPCSFPMELLLSKGSILN